ncbi:XRE family transcriptional regulator [Oleomonas cavernae]|uniref:XRE family transcriptional regulator n=1 Tax=Oleomonas cavernae TaxID=2320859 RepID=A0A418WU97_9PROT|nr:helix-turn-helix transcriptional regulator [Oleomonas cavernae]RJF94844.1 XRE family transcriptional regulator [Oleomonas cavernae]
MTVGARLKQFRESKGLSQEEFADAIGTTQRSLSRYEADETELKVSAVQRLAEIGCDTAWLVTGATPLSHPSEVSAVGLLLIEIPHYAVAFSAGNGRSAAPEDEAFHSLTVPEEWARRVTRRNPKHLIMALAEGNSMEPTIGDGATLLIDKTDQALSNGRIYALVVDDTLFVKRVRRTLKGEIFLTSDNKSFPEEQLDNDETRDIRIIGQVVWSGGALA